jgi:methyltransferase (TIGR00027 family)
MRTGEPSATAQRVAAHRLGFERAAAPFGDPAADERLARDVARSTSVASGTRMATYLQARTSFFDRVVLRTLEAGVAQVVVAAAGYDGRALRYAKPDVRWFELDHPDTQADKLERLSRLAIETRGVAFASADFSVDDVGAALAGAGHDRARPTLFLCEGVAVYLERPVLTRLLAGLRSAAADGSRLAISLSVSTSASPGLSDRRQAFGAAVAALGEPARTVLTAGEADELLAATGWRAVPPATTLDARQRRVRRAGLLVAVPV